MSKQKKDTSFEEGLIRLEEIASILEEGKISLEDSIAIFEEGMKLTKVCNEKLESIENTIHILIQENGNMKEEKFDIDGVEKNGL